MLSRPKIRTLGSWSKITMPIIAECIQSGQYYHVKGGTSYPCPRCDDGILEPFDHCKRIQKYDGGEAEVYFIPRGQCTKDGCGCTIRMLPIGFTPNKHYGTGVIEDVLDEKMIPDDYVSEAYPCAQTMRNWLMWFQNNLTYIEAMFRSIMNRLLGYSDEILISGISVVSWAHRTDPTMWLGVIQRCIYNAGGALQPL